MTVPTISLLVFCYRGTFVQWGPLFWTGVQSDRVIDPSVAERSCPRSDATLSNLSNYLFVFVCLLCMHVNKIH